MAAFPPSSFPCSSHDEVHYYCSSNLDHMNNGAFLPHFHYQSQTLAEDTTNLPPNPNYTNEATLTTTTTHHHVANSSSSAASIVTDYYKLHHNHTTTITTAEDLLPTLNPTRKRKSKSNSNSTILQSLQGMNTKKMMKECEGKKDVKSNKKEEKKIAPADGYIHVRAKRGQATDSHSLAERVRREKISERMRLLQALVPGCDRVTGKALMLDEIINYVRSLQNQVEILSMKLASVDPMFYCPSGMDLETFPDQNLHNSSLVASSTALDQNPQFVHNSSASDGSHLIPHTPIFPNPLSQVLWEVDDQRQELINQSDIMGNLFSSLY